jgi:hypothetical protein
MTLKLTSKNILIRYIYFALAFIIVYKTLLIDINLNLKLIVSLQRPCTKYMMFKAAF